MHLGGPCLSTDSKFVLAARVLVLPGSMFSAFFRSTSSLHARDEAAWIMSSLLDLVLELVFPMGEGESTKSDMSISVVFDLAGREEVRSVVEDAP